MAYTSSQINKEYLTKHHSIMDTLDQLKLLEKSLNMDHSYGESYEDVCEEIEVFDRSGRRHVHKKKNVGLIPPNPPPVTAKKPIKFRADAQQEALKALGDLMEKDRKEMGKYTPVTEPVTSGYYQTLKPAGYLYMGTFWLNKPYGNEAEIIPVFAAPKHLLNTAGELLLKTV